MARRDLPPTFPSRPPYAGTWPCERCHKISLTIEAVEWDPCFRFVVRVSGQHQDRGPAKAFIQAATKTRPPRRRSPPRPRPRPPVRSRTPGRRRRPRRGAAPSPINPHPTCLNATFGRCVLSLVILGWAVDALIPLKDVPFAAYARDHATAKQDEFDKLLKEAAARRRRRRPPRAEGTWRTSRSGRSGRST